ncbi:hypothetical protein J4421_01530 [Candidatus Woesearchaeota archaeon]|nr:hypothetical protein [Candidatus Woesearchaeota archaeon]
MKIIIAKEVFEKFHPQFAIAFLQVNSFDPQSKLEESCHLLQEQERLVQLLFHKNTKKYHELISNWRVVVEGLKGKHYSTSLEKIMRTVLSKRTLATKNSLQNLVYYIALKYFVPVGIDDSKSIDHDLTFSIATGVEKGGSFRKLKKGELYYKDKKGIIATRLDYWKSSRTKLRKNSTAALIHIEAVPPITLENLKKMAQELSTLLKTFCYARTKLVILVKEDNQRVF